MTSAAAISVLIYVADFGLTVLAQFVEAVGETDRDRLTELAKLVEGKLASRKKRGG